MLAHSPPLPLVFDYNVPDTHNFNFCAEEKDEIIHALKQRTRVRRIRFKILVSNLPDFITSIDGEYPMLEYLIVNPPLADNRTALTLPETLRAPRLRHLLLSRFALPIESRLFPTTVALVTLTLFMGYPSTDFKPNIFLQWLALMPQLEELSVLILLPVPVEDVESQHMRTPIMTHVTLPNLRLFDFHGDSTFEEALVRRMITPHLERLCFWFIEQPTFSVPNLLHFMNTMRHLKFDNVKITFYIAHIFVEVTAGSSYVFSIAVYCAPLDFQVSSVTQIFDSIGQIFSTVESLSLGYEFYVEQNVFDRTEWRRLLRPFSNLKTLHIDEELVEGASHCLRPDDGENPLGLFPELQELTYSGRSDTGDAFTSFIDARQSAGRPVTLVFEPSPRLRPLVTRAESGQASLDSSSSVTWNSEVAEAGTWAGTDPDN